MFCSERQLLRLMVCRSSANMCNDQGTRRCPWCPVLLETGASHPNAARASPATAWRRMSARAAATSTAPARPAPPRSQASAGKSPTQLKWPPHSRCPGSVRPRQPCQTAQRVCLGEPSAALHPGYLVPRLLHKRAPCPGTQHVQSPQTRSTCASESGCLVSSRLQRSWLQK